MHMADSTVFGFDVDEIDRTSQRITVRLDKKGLGADEVVGAGRNEKGTGIAADERTRRKRLKVLPVLVTGADEPGECALREAASFRIRCEIIGRTVKHHAPGLEGLRPDGQGGVFRCLGHVKGQMATRRIAGQEHPVLVEIELLEVGRQIIQRGCAVGQFIGYVRDSVVDSVLQQHHIVAFPKEHGSEATVVLTLPDIIILSIGSVTLKEQPVTPNRMETDISVK